MNKLLSKIIKPSVFLSILLCSQSSFASGLLTPSDGATPALEITEHHVEVVIENGYAITTVEQIFYNPNNIDLEANYSFPVPEKAAVSEFIYWIDGQPVIAEVVEQKKAEQIYQQEKQAGREVAVTKQDKYKTFDSKVYPVKAQQKVRIKLAYIQPVHVETSMGRYVYPLEDGGVDDEKLAFWNYQTEVKEKFSFNLVFRSAYPVQQFRLPKHPQASIVQTDKDEWSVTMNSNLGDLAAEEGIQVNNGAPAFSLNEDIVVYWRLQENLPAAVDLVTYKEPGKDRGTFMMTVTPGMDLAPITVGRDWVFVLDFSGSMNGKYHSMVAGVNKSLDRMNTNDRFKIIIFNSKAHDITSGYVPATKQNVLHWGAQLEQQTPENSTNLYDGLYLAMKNLDDDRSSGIVLVTDGVANVGKTEKQGFIKLLEQYDVRLFTFVMGNSANRPLLDGMTKVSNGFAISVSNSDDIVGQLMQATAKLSFVALHDIEVKVSGVKVKDLTPKNVHSLYNGQQLIVFGHYYGEGNAELVIKGKISGADKRYTSEFNFPEQHTTNPEIERLWAFATIENLQDKIDYLGSDADIEQAITDLAVEYGLVTPYTSMIVMRDEQFQQHNIKRNNKTRVATEHVARQNRKQQKVQNNRVDTNKPMFTKSRPSHSSGGGGGSLTPWMLMLILPMLAKRLIKSTKS